MNVLVTDHAKERFAERGGIIIKKLAERAFNTGEPLTKKEQEVMFERGMFRYGYMYKKLLGLIWVFQIQQKDAVLVTILYPKFFSSKHTRVRF